MKLHVVSFQMPYPPDYGGVIDVYYKLKALKEAGCRVTLHTFCYGREPDSRLDEVVEETKYYDRREGLLSQVSLLPYIVRSRAVGKLYRDLEKDDDPILFEGLHTCRFLPRLAKRGRCLMVRAHNVEHDYYRMLARSEGSCWKKVYYMIESWKLRRYERVLKDASVIFAISEADVDYFRREYEGVSVEHLPAFFDDEHKWEEKGAREMNGGIDILYHGNLEVMENERAALFIIDRVKPLLAKGTRVVVAGHNPGRKLKASCERSGVELVDNPESEELDRMIATARVNLLVSDQPTGVKLKLMKVLALGRGGCVVNSNLVTDRKLGELCKKADSPEAIARAVGEYLLTPLTEEEADARRAKFLESYSTRRGALKICSRLKG